MRDKPATIDAYLLAIQRDRRQPLEDLRRTIGRAVPAVQECISYGIPAFRVEGGIVAGVAATKAGYSYYPFSGQTLSALSDEVEGYKGTKSALHFSAKQPLPAGLVRKLLQTRLAEIRRKRAVSNQPKPEATRIRSKQR
jgi:uncharacterized protein YdhG (YjbR/CyaY superfamily)